MNYGYINTVTKYFYEVITKIESKYSYTKRVKVLNPNYAENQQY